jgi:hypothetical protein
MPKTQSVMLAPGVRAGNANLHLFIHQIQKEHDIWRFPSIFCFTFKQLNNAFVEALQVICVSEPVATGIDVA